MSSCPHNEISIPMVGALPIHLAVIEMIELFVFLLYQKHRTSTLQGCHLKVKICTIGLNTGSDQAWFSVRIKCSDLEACEPSLGEVLPGFGRSVLDIVLKMQKIFPGEFLWMERVEERGERVLVWHMVVEEGNKFRKRTERKAGRAGSDPPARETSICWKVAQSKEYMVGECERICSYMHRLKIFTPLCNIQFYLNVWGVVSSSKFDWNCNRTTLGQRKMASDIEHFVAAEERPAGTHKIYPKLGLPYTLPNNKGQLQDDILRITALSALVPPPLNTELGTSQLNTKCDRIKVVFYGPGGVPLLPPNQSQSGLYPATIIKLDDYGLAFGEIIREIASTQEMINVDWCYKLRPAEEDCHESLLDWSENGPTAITDHKYTILLFIFLERIKTETEWSAEDNLYLIDNLRQNLVSLLCRHKSKVRKAISGVLNKLLQNFSKADQKQELINKTINTVSSSIYGMLARSGSQAFQRRCMDHLEVDSLPDAQGMIKSNLWMIATERFGDFAKSSQQLKVLKARKKRPSDNESHIEAKKQPDGFDDLATAVESVGGLGPQMELIPPTAVAKLPSTDVAHLPDLLKPLGYDIQDRLSPFEGLLRQTETRDLDLDPRPGDHGNDQLLDFLCSLEPSTVDEHAKGKKCEKTAVDSWDILSSDALLTSLGDLPYSVDFNPNTADAYNDGASTSALQSGMLSPSTTNMVASQTLPSNTAPSTWSKPTQVKDHFLPQIVEKENSPKDTENWLNAFSCWDDD